MIRLSRLVAGGVVVTLAGVVVLALGGEDGKVGPPRVTATIGERTPTSIAVDDAEVPAVTSAADGTDPSDPIAVIDEAMAAWGRFAVSGETAEVAPWFAEQGPQMGRFLEEAPGLAAGPLGDPPYTVTVADSGTERTDDGLRIRAEVLFVRTGEPTQRFDWVIVLRRTDSDWLVWTVEEAGASGR